MTPLESEPRTSSEGPSDLEYARPVVSTIQDGQPAGRMSPPVRPTVRRQLTRRVPSVRWQLTRQVPEKNPIIVQKDGLGVTCVVVQAR